jgi:hypothetical protein
VLTFQSDSNVNTSGGGLKAPMLLLQFLQTAEAPDVAAPGV